MHPLIILEVGAEDGLKLGRKAEIPLVKFPNRFCETQMNQMKGKQERDRDLCPQGGRGGRMSSAGSSPVQPATRQSAGRHGLVSKHFLDEKPVNTTC